MTPNIRPTKLDDLESVRTIILACGITWDNPTPESFSTMIGMGGNLFFVAEIDGVVVGTTFAMHDGGSIGYIYRLAVDPKQQARGIGRLLVGHVVAIMQGIGVPRVFAWIQPNNFVSQKTFSHMGFEQRPGVIFRRKS